MFNKNEDPHEIPTNGEETVVGASVRVTGNLESQDNIRIEGSVKGSINTQGDVMIGQQAKVEAAGITGRNVIVAGEILGKVTAESLLEIKGAGKVVGDVSCQELIIEQGARFDGNCQMSEAASSPDKSKKKV